MAAPLTITSRLFKPVDFPGGFGDGMNYCNGGVIQKMQVEIDFYSFLGYEHKKVKFNALDKSIENNDTANDTTNFILAGWAAGMSISVNGTASNDGTYTIVSVSETKIFVAESLVNETNNDTSIFDQTSLTAFDFYYNLINSKLPENYNSLTDVNVRQRFSVSGVDASDTYLPNNFIANSYSLAWVTNNLTVPSTGETAEVQIIGMGIFNRAQHFRITQIFSIAPFWTTDLLNNFQTNTRPSYFSGYNLQYIFRIDAKESAIDVIPFYTGAITNQPDSTCWLNDNNIQSLPEYWISGFGTDQKPDINRPFTLPIILKSRNAKFVKNHGGSPNTKIIVDFIYLPQDASDYQDTTTTLRQNLMNDRVVITTDSSPTNGQYFGTDYQVLKDVYVSGFTTSQLTFGLTIDLSTFLKNRLKAKNDSNLNFAIIITTQDVGISTAQQRDRISAYKIWNFVYDRDDSSLLQAVDTFHVKPYPDRPDDTVLNGVEGEPGRANYPFRIKTTPDSDGNTPTLLNAGLQIVAFNEFFEDFPLDSIIFDTSLTTKLQGTQEIDLSLTRNFVTYPGDNYNICSIKRNQSYDVGVMKGFDLNYAFVLRYEYWRQIVQLAQQYLFPIYRDISGITEAWKTIQQNRWFLKLKFTANVLGTDGHVTPFTDYADVTILDSNHTSIAPAVGAIQMQYFDENGNELKGVNIGGKTFVRGTYYKATWGADSPYINWYGYVFADVATDYGGMNNRRFACSQFNSETDSPFKAPAADLLADNSISSENCTVNFFNGSRITIETIFDDSKQHWGIQNNGLLFAARLGYPNNETIRNFNDETQHLFNDNSTLIFQNN